MSVTVAGINFDHHEYDRRADVLYLSVEGYQGPRAHAFATSEGHNIEHDESGRVVAMTLVNVRWLLERGGELTITGRLSTSTRTSSPKPSRRSSSTDQPAVACWRTGLFPSICFAPCVSLHGFRIERNRPPPRPRAFRWLHAWAFGGRGVSGVRSGRRREPR